MVLTSERLDLNPLTIEDFEEIHELHSQPMVAQYNTIGIPEDISETVLLMEKALKTPVEDLWVIRKKESGEFVGEIGLKLSSEKYRKGEVHYSLHPDQWGNGYATEALKMVINFGFSHLKLHRLEAGVAVDNLRSVSVLERVGMQREGLCRKILPLQTGWADNYMYAILDEDPRDY